MISGITAHSISTIHFAGRKSNRQKAQEHLQAELGDQYDVILNPPQSQRDLQVSLKNNQIYPPDEIQKRLTEALLKISGVKQGKYDYLFEYTHQGKQYGIILSNPRTIDRPNIHPRKP